MEIIEKFVEFNEFCHRCKHKSVPETEDPCNECLTEPINEHSHKPVNFEKFEKKVVKDAGD
jgi:hypothetical protein